MEGRVIKSEKLKEQRGQRARWVTEVNIEVTQVGGLIAVA